MKAPGRISKTEHWAHGGILLHRPLDSPEGASFSLSTDLCCPLGHLWRPAGTCPHLPLSLSLPSFPHQSPRPATSTHPEAMGPVQPSVWRPRPQPAAPGSCGHGEARLTQHPTPVAGGRCAQSLSDFRTRTHFSAWYQGYRWPTLWLAGTQSGPPGSPCSRAGRERLRVFHSHQKGTSWVASTGSQGTAEDCLQRGEGLRSGRRQGRTCVCSPEPPAFCKLMTVFPLIIWVVLGRPRGRPAPRATGLQEVVQRKPGVSW